MKISRGRNIVVHEVSLRKAIADIVYEASLITDGNDVEQVRKIGAMMGSLSDYLDTAPTAPKPELQREGYGGVKH